MKSKAIITYLVITPFLYVPVLLKFQDLSFYVYIYLCIMLIVHLFTNKEMILKSLKQEDGTYLSIKHLSIMNILYIVYTASFMFIFILNELIKAYLRSQVDGI